MARAVSARSDAAGRLAVMSKRVTCQAAAASSCPKATVADRSRVMRDEMRTVRTIFISVRDYFDERVSRKGAKRRPKLAKE
jgi:hypothetical protein